MKKFLYQIKFEGSKGTKKLEVLFDSGASDSMMKREFAEQLEILTKLPRPLSFETAREGDKIEVTERVICDFYIDEIRLYDDFLVIENLSEEAIIGAATMQKWRMKLNFEEDRIIIDPRVARKILK